MLILSLINYFTTFIAIVIAYIVHLMRNRLYFSADSIISIVYLLTILMPVYLVLLVLIRYHIEFIYKNITTYEFIKSKEIRHLNRGLTNYFRLFCTPIPPRYETYDIRGLLKKYLIENSKKGISTKKISNKIELKILPTSPNQYQ
jgi:hypothetical protein